MNPSRQQPPKPTSNALDAAPQALLHKGHIDRYRPLRLLLAQRKQPDGAHLPGGRPCKPDRPEAAPFGLVPQERFKQAHIAVGGGRQIGFHGIAFQGAKQVDFEAIEAALFGSHIAV